MDDMGYAGVKLTVKSDGEPAIVALVEAIAVSRKAETVPVQRGNFNVMAKSSGRSERGEDSL